MKSRTAQKPFTTLTRDTLMDNSQHRVRIKGEYPCVSKDARAFPPNTNGASIATDLIHCKLNATWVARVSIEC